MTPGMPSVGLNAGLQPPMAKASELLAADPAPSEPIPVYTGPTKTGAALIAAVAVDAEKQTPPRHGAFRPKLRYAHQGGMKPPLIVIHGNSLEHVTEVYKRYLEGRFRAHFKLVGTPLRIEMRSSSNPFADKD